jgi:hypothetical protein
MQRLRCRTNLIQEWENHADGYTAVIPHFSFHRRRHRVAIGTSSIPAFTKTHRRLIQSFFLIFLAPATISTTPLKPTTRKSAWPRQPATWPRQPASRPRQPAALNPKDVRDIFRNFGLLLRILDFCGLRKLSLQFSFIRL